jgi:addiction module RelE/StbE family toxin
MKELDYAPTAIKARYEKWKSVVMMSGPIGLRLVPGFKDHALKGEWLGARSSSLNDKWRVIYVIESETLTVKVIRASAHDYRRF